MTNLADELIQITAAAREKQARKAAQAEAARRDARERDVSFVAREFVAERLLHLDRLLHQAAEQGRTEHQVWKHQQHESRQSVNDEGVVRGMHQVSAWLKDRGIKAVLHDTGWQEDEGYSGRTYTLTAMWGTTATP